MYSIARPAGQNPWLYLIAAADIEYAIDSFSGIPSSCVWGKKKSQSPGNFLCKDSTADLYFLEFWGIHWVRGQTVYKNVGLGWFGVAFWLLQAKSCRIIMKLHQTVYIRNVTVLMKSWNLDMSGPAWASLGGQILVSRVWFSFVFPPRTYTFPFYYQLHDFNQNGLLSTFIFPKTKWFVSISKFMIC